VGIKIAGPDLKVIEKIGPARSMWWATEIAAENVATLKGSWTSNYLKRFHHETPHFPAQRAQDPH
jgi:hypothetical protein